MASEHTFSSRRTRIISLITLICEMEGIESPEPCGFTDEPPNALSTEQIDLLEIIVNERAAVERIMAEDDSSIAEDASQNLYIDEDNGRQDVEMEDVQELLVCHTCGKHFKSKATFDQHGREVHIGTECHFPRCTFAADSEAELNMHLHSHKAHDNNKQCGWPGCGAQFTLQESLMRHIRRHIIAAGRAA